MLFSIYYILVAFISNIFIGTITFLLFQTFFQAKWSENIEKIAIKSAKIELLLLIILFLPIITDLVLIGNIRIYFDNIYSNHNFLSVYYNHIFVLFRLIFYCLSFIFIFYKLNKANPFRIKKIPYLINEKAKRTLKYPSLYLVFLFVICNFFGIDLLMSIQNSWSSAVWGIYFISISYIVSISLITVLRIKSIKKSRKICDNENELENAGKLIFGINFFWAYIFYIQILIIIYGNLPQEMIFLDIRMSGFYQHLFYFIAIFHFIIPSLLLLPTGFKKNKKILIISACSIIISTIAELYWIIIPVIENKQIFILNC